MTRSAWSRSPSPPEYVLALEVTSAHDSISVFRNERGGETVVLDDAGVDSVLSNKEEHQLLNDPATVFWRSGAFLAAHNRSGWEQGKTAMQGIESAFRNTKSPTFLSLFEALGIADKMAGFDASISVSLFTSDLDLPNETWIKATYPRLIPFAHRTAISRLR